MKQSQFCVAASATRGKPSRGAIEITCHDHSMLLRSARYYILSASFDIYLWWLSHHFAMWWYLYHYNSELLRSTTAYVFHRGYGVSTNCCNCRMVISQRHSTKTLTGLQNKTKYPTTENKRITEIAGSHEINFELKSSKI